MTDDLEREENARRLDEEINKKEEVVLTLDERISRLRKLDQELNIREQSH